MALREPFVTCIYRCLLQLQRHCCCIVTIVASILWYWYYYIFSSTLTMSTSNMMVHYIISSVIITIIIIMTINHQKHHWSWIIANVLIWCLLFDHIKHYNKDDCYEPETPYTPDRSWKSPPPFLMAQRPSEDSDGRGCVRCGASRFHPKLGGFVEPTKRSDCRN